MMEMNKELTMREFVNKEILEASDTIRKLIEADKDNQVIKGEHLRVFDDTVKSKLDEAKKKEENLKLAKSIVDKDMKTVESVLDVMSSKYDVSIGVSHLYSHTVYVNLKQVVRVHVNNYEHSANMFNVEVNLEDKEHVETIKLYIKNDGSYVYSNDEMHDETSDDFINYIVSNVAESVANELIEKEG